jgi:uncharacterized protein YbaR (Trm112 family)/SAM-dependent methyltransferase
MNPRLLDFVVCPACRSDLKPVSFVAAEDEADSGRGLSVVQGALVCSACARAYPIIDGIPELLPDPLRDSGREAEFFGRHGFVPGPSAPRPEESEEDWTHRRAELALPWRDDLPPGFFEPAGSLPFEASHPVRSIDRILRFMTAVRHTDLRRGDAVLDLGVGFAWTSEWLHKLGYVVVGVDLNRAYLEAGRKRAGAALPFLLVADVENLPLRREMFLGVLVFDAFHHLAHRRKSLESFAEVLAPGGRLVLAEPGARHELQSSSREVMDKFGILEKGVAPRELARMIKATGFESRPRGFRAVVARAAVAAVGSGASLAGKVSRRLDFLLGAPRGTVEKIPHPYGEVEILKLRKKGVRIYTSRNPDLLLARVTASPEEVEIEPGRPWRLGLSVRNAGNTVWLRKTEDGVGEVKVGFFIAEAGGSKATRDYHRLPIPGDVRPGEAFAVETDLPALDSRGVFILEIDLLSEGVMRFKDSFHAPRILTIRVS